MSSLDPALLEQHIAAQVQQQVQHAMQVVMQQQHQSAPGGSSSSSTALAATPSRNIGKLHDADRYSGDGDFDAWLSRMHQLCNFYGLTTDAQHLAYAAAHLKGAALQWWSSLTAPLPTTLIDFVSRLRDRFQPITTAETARLKLRNLTQGRGGVQVYVNAFNALLVSVPTMAVDDRIFAFIHGLNERTQAHVNEIAHTTLASAIERAVRFGSRSQVAASSASSHREASSSNSTPMDLDAVSLALDEETNFDNVEAARERL